MKRINTIKGGRCRCCGRGFSTWEVPSSMKGSPIMPSCCPRCTKLIAGKKPTSSEAADAKGHKVPRVKLRLLREEIGAGQEPVTVQKSKPGKTHAIPKKPKRPSRFAIMFPLLKQGVTKPELVKACLAADKKAGIAGRSKPDRTVHGFMNHLRSGTLKAFGIWDTVITTDDAGEKVYKIKKHKGEGAGERIVK